MARTLDEIRASRPTVDRTKLDRTSEAAIRQHMAEDGSAPGAPLSDFVLRRRPGQRGAGRRPAKVSVTLRIDQDTLARWRSSGPGWQTRAVRLLRDADVGAPEASPLPTRRSRRG